MDERPHGASRPDVDEYVEATPKNLRLRKKILDENQRKRSEKGRAVKFLEA